MTNVKEVQTDHDILVRYFNDIDQLNDIDVKRLIKAKKLTYYDGFQIRVRNAFAKSPKIKFLEKPIHGLLRRVRSNHSTLKPKTLKKTLNLIAEII